MANSKKQVITFIDSTGLKATLKAIARRNGRSLGAEIRRILEAEIERRELEGENGKQHNG